MPAKTKSTEKVKTVGKSWVLRLPKSFTRRNNLEAGTQVLLTVRDGSKVEAEILPPLSDKISRIANDVLGRRGAVYEELKALGD